MHLRSQKEDPRRYQRRLEVLEPSRPPSDNEREQEVGERVGQLSNANSPRIGFVSHVEDDLRGDRVDSAVEDPSFDGKGEDGQGEIGITVEKDMSDEAVTSSLPFCMKEAF